MDSIPYILSKVLIALHIRCKFECYWLLTAKLMAYRNTRGQKKKNKRSYFVLPLLGFERGEN